MYEKSKFPKVLKKIRGKETFAFERFNSDEQSL